MNIYEKLILDNIESIKKFYQDNGCDENSYRSDVDYEYLQGRLEDLASNYTPTLQEM